MNAAVLAGAWALALFGAGALVIAAYGLGNRAKARELWAAYASTVAIAAVLIVPLAISPLAFAAVVAAGAWRCAVELAITYRVRVGSARHAAIAASMVAATAWGLAQQPGAMQWLYVATAAVIVVTAPLYVRAFAAAPSGWRGGVLALAFPCVAAAHLAHLANRPDGVAWVFVLYMTVEAQDSAAYLCGRLFGRRLLLPRLSPKKTVGGAIAGWTVGFAVGAGAAWGLLGLAVAAALALGAGIVAAGFCGDLFTSALKRGAGVKDFPAVARLHGGALDIYDSTLFAAAVVDCALYIIGA